MKIQDIKSESVRSDLMDAEYGADEDCSPREWFNRWLEWNGILGYTRVILDAVQGLGGSFPGEEEE